MMSGSSRAADSTRNDDVARIREFVLGYQAAELRKSAITFGAAIASTVVDRTLRGRR
jgi:hypothetical protein